MAPPCVSSDYGARNIVCDDQKREILIAANHPANVQHLRLLLEHEGHPVVAVGSVAEIFENASGKPPDLLFVQMGMTGDDVDLCRKLRSDPATAEIPVVLMASESRPGERIRALELGVAGYLDWPFVAAEVLKCTREQLWLRQLQRDNIRLRNELGNAKVATLAAEMARGVAHNYLNLLTGIQGYVGLLEFGLLDSPDLGEYLTQIQDLLKRATTLTGDLASCARLVGITHEEVTVAELAAELFRPLPEWKGKWRLSVEEISGSGKLNCNPGHLRRAMTILLTNAAEAMPKGGTVTVMGSVQPPLSTFSPPSSQGNEHFRIQVKDHGVGLASEETSKVFQPFFTTKAKGGAGLGLAMAKAIVLAHQGEISFSSRPGRGSTVVIDLPMPMPNGLTSHANRGPKFCAAAKTRK